MKYRVGKKTSKGYAILKSSTGEKWKVMTHSSTLRKAKSGIKASQMGRKAKW